jgi:hypothetical protein
MFLRWDHVSCPYCIKQNGLVDCVLPLLSRVITCTVGVLTQNAGFPAFSVSFVVVSSHTCQAPMSITVLVNVEGLEEPCHLQTEGHQKIREVIDGLVKQHVVNGGVHRPVSYGLYWAEKKVCVVDTKCLVYRVLLFHVLGHYSVLLVFSCGLWMH